MIRIPDTDLVLSDVGLGTAKAGLTYREADEIVARFMDLGGNLIDTARVYSDWVPGEIGRSERVIGDALSRLGTRNKAVLMTKGGHPDITHGFDMTKSRVSAGDMRVDLELSLKALRTDTIDIYLYHRDNPEISVPELIEIMEDFRREGKIRYYACSNWSAARMMEADRYCEEKGYRGFIADQSLQNAGVRGMNPPMDPTLTVAKEDIFEYHRENPHNMLMPFSSVAEGYFHRWILKGEGGGVYDTEENRKLAERIRELCEQYSASITQVLLSYFKTLPMQVLPLFGPKDMSQIDDMMMTVDIPAEAFEV